LLRHYWGRLVLVDTREEGILPGMFFEVLCVIYHV